jgi:hypothetical protein
MFPYDSRLLRCHPCWIQLRSPITNADIHISSHKKLSWVCCECSHVFDKAPKDVTVSTCRCKAHWKPLKKINRMRYSGNIPKQITNAIRAGLLQRVTTDSLLQLVISLVGGDNKSGTVANVYVDEISKYPKEQLLDGGFWWEDTYQHKDGSRYKQLPSAKRQRKQTRSHDFAEMPLFSEEIHKQEKGVMSTTLEEPQEPNGMHSLAPPFANVEPKKQTSPTFCM